MSEIIEELQGKNSVLERSLAQATEVSSVEPEGWFKLKLLI